MSTLRLPNGTVVADGKVIHRPAPPVVREVRQLNLQAKPLAKAIEKVVSHG